MSQPSPVSPAPSPALFDLYDCDHCGTVRLPRQVPRIAVCPNCTARGLEPLRALRYLRGASARPLIGELALLATQAARSDLTRVEERAALARRLRELAATLDEEP